MSSGHLPDEEDVEVGVLEDDSAAADARASPDLPQYPRSDAQDITAISGVDLMLLYFTEIRMITAVPNCLREAWAKANATVYQ